jgi:hypothetical protein
MERTCVCIGALKISGAVEAQCAAQGLDEVFKCANTQVGVAATQVGVCSMRVPVLGAIGA